METVIGIGLDQGDEHRDHLVSEKAMHAIKIANTITKRNMQTQDALEQAFAIRNLVGFDSGAGGLTRARITTAWSTAEVYLYGAQVTGFQRKGKSPLLFLSGQSRFEPGKAIRGGVPICFPWFGAREGGPAHGFARITEWELVEAKAVGGGGAVLGFRLPASAGGHEWPSLQAELILSVAESLTMELRVTNQSNVAELSFEECLHSYFSVSDIGHIAITGLAGAEYADHLDNDRAHTTSPEPIRISAQTDRTYFDHEGVLEIHDPGLGRVIRIAKSGSASSVIWNPWTTQMLADLGPDEYRRMVCVESGNVGRNWIVLGPKQSAVLRVEWSERRMAD